MAHEQYRGTEDANPVRVTAYFTRADSQRRNKTEMARSLAEFVKANRHRANPVIVLSAPEVPQGFGSMSIAAEPGDWWCGECGGITVSEIREQLNSRIAAKNMHAERYRANLLKEAQIWLLMYSRFEVSRNVPIPYGIEEWKFPLEFERVFWFDCLENEVAEIQREQ